MIKRIESENVRIGRVAEDTVILTIRDNDTQLSIDELNELCKVTSQFWDCNSLWHLTKEAKAERERYEDVSSLAKVSNY